MVSAGLLLKVVDFALRRILMGLSAIVIVTVAASAQDVARGKDIYMSKAGCPFCHGWAGDGRGDPRSEGGAPSLRVSTLDRDQIAEVIQCGRPATGMPYHDRFAYTDKRCYGMSEADIGPDKPKRGDQTLQREEIQALADYVAAKIIGKPPVTKEECIEYFGSEINECRLVAGRPG
jgi:mono/diheme cytochrome c family protein